MKSSKAKTKEMGKMNRNVLKTVFKYASLFTQLGFVSDQAKKREIYEELKRIEKDLQMKKEEIIELAIKNKK